MAKAFCYLFGLIFLVTSVVVFAFLEPDTLAEFGQEILDENTPPVY